MMVNENAISGKTFFMIFPLMSSPRLTAINTPNIHSVPMMMGTLMAAAI